MELSDNSKKMRKMIQVDLEEYIAFEKLQALIMQHRRYEKDFFLSIGKKENQDRYLELFEKASNEVLATIKRIKDQQNHITNEEAELRKHFVKSYLAYKEGFSKVTQQVRARENITARYANNVIMEPVKKHIYSFEQDLGKLMKISVRNIGEISDDIVAAGRRARVFIGVLLIIGVVVSLIMGLLIAKMITTPVYLAVNFAKEVAKGNLSLNVDKEYLEIKDEIGQLANAMNTMVLNLREIFSKISSGSQSLSASSTELASISEQMSDGSEHTSEKSNSVASAAEEMSANMNSVASATEQASASLQMIVAAAEQLSSTINEVAQNMAKGSEITNEAVDQAGGISDKMNTLGQAASEITKVTETIADISEQTNLLALNATIEAARAGEAGKGFAVVAGEIKDLAHQTANATGEISERIANVQVLTQESVTSIESIVTIINEINDIVSSVAAGIEEQSAATQEISNNVTQAAQGVQEINENINQASVASTEVSSDVHEVSSLAEDMNTNSTHVNSSAVELSKLSEELNAIVARFQLQ